MHNRDGRATVRHVIAAVVALIAFGIYVDVLYRALSSGPLS